MPEGKVAAISGGLGDTLYAVGVMQRIGVKTLYVKAGNYPSGYGNSVTALKRIMKLQGIEVLPTGPCYPFFQYEPGLVYDYDFDLARNQLKRGRDHIVRSFIKQFCAEYDWKNPWLTIDEEELTTGDPYTLIALTPRWRDNSRVNWSRYRARMQGRVCFVGFEEDWLQFCKRHGEVEYIYTIDLLAMARVIRDAEVLYTNQSPALVIAQGIGQRYFLELKPGRTNTRLWTRNETILM
jgi:hypothetical protein